MVGWTEDADYYRRDLRHVDDDMYSLCYAYNYFFILHRSAKCIFLSIYFSSGTSHFVPCWGLLMRLEGIYSQKQHKQAVGHQTIARAILMSEKGKHRQPACTFSIQDELSGATLDNGRE